MNKFDNIPDAVPLDDESVFCLSIALAFLNDFPPTLRKFARLNPQHLRSAVVARELSHYGLLSAAYIGFAPIATSYDRFIDKAEQINRWEVSDQAAAFRNDYKKRENSAAGDFGYWRGELERLFKHVDAYAKRVAGVASYDALFNCKDEILQDQSSSAPADRETYAEGPLYLWDLAKAVSEHKLTDMAFDTFGGWVLFVHCENGVVSGHAIHPLAHRFGNFSWNPLVNIDWLRVHGGPLLSVMEVPVEVQAAVKALAGQCFPTSAFQYVPPPLTYSGAVYRSRKVRPDHPRHNAEA